MSYYNRYYRSNWFRTSDQMLRCGFTIGQSWHGLKKAWIAYRLSKEEEDTDLMKLYASVIQKIQRQLGIKVSEFPELRFYDFGDQTGYLPTDRRPF